MARVVLAESVGEAVQEIDRLAAKGMAACDWSTALRMLAVAIICMARVSFAVEEIERMRRLISLIEPAISVATPV